MQEGLIRAAKASAYASGKDYMDTSCAGQALGYSVDAPLSVKLANLLTTASEALGNARTIRGRLFGWPAEASSTMASSQLNVVREDTVENTLSDLRNTIDALATVNAEINCRI